MKEIIPFHEKFDADVNPKSLANSKFFNFANCDLRIVNWYKSNPLPLCLLSPTKLPYFLEVRRGEKGKKLAMYRFVQLVILQAITTIEEETVKSDKKRPRLKNICSKSGSALNDLASFNSLSKIPRKNL